MVNCDNVLTSKISSLRVQKHCISNILSVCKRNLGYLFDLSQSLLTFPFFAEAFPNKKISLETK